MIQRCKKCQAPKGSSHRWECPVRKNPSGFDQSLLYTTITDTSSSSSGSCDTSSSSSSSSDCGGGGGGGE